MCHSFHHVALQSDFFALSELEKIEGIAQEGVPNLEETSLVLGRHSIATRGAIPNPKRIDAWRVVSNGAKWRLEFRLRPSIKPLRKTGKAVGVDPGLKYWIVTSDGGKVPQHPEAVRLNKLIEEQQNQRDSKKTDSTRYKELSRNISRNQQRLYDAQRDAANKLAANLVARYDVIAVEEIDATDRGIRNDPKYAQDSIKANWPLMIETIKLRCIEAGKTFVLVNKWWTSQECSNCTGWVKMHVDDRNFCCDHCGHSDDRDINAAKTILKRGYEILDGSSERVRRNAWFPKKHPNYVGN